MKKINILGTEYSLEFRKRTDDPNLESNDGYTDTSVKLLVVEDMQQEKGSKIDLAAYTKAVVRHEITHAFLHESGLDASSNCYYEGWAKNEEMVDWFAIQSPKLFKAFQEADAL